MEMVATAKIRKAQERIESARPYAIAMIELLAKVATHVQSTEHPLLQVHEEPKRAIVVLLTSDRGLAGAFSSNIIKLASETGAGEAASGLEVDYVALGRKGVGHFRYMGKDLLAEYVGSSENPRFSLAKEIAEKLIKAYEEGEADRIWLVFNRFHSVVEQKPTRHLLLPIEQVNLPEEREPEVAAEYLFEPSPQDVLSRLLPTYIETLVYRAMMESAASEQGARRTAMKSATDNAGKMIDNLKRSYNRARQAQITQEISEIVGGAQGLKG